MIGTSRGRETNKMINRDVERAARRVAAAIVARRDAIPKRAASVLILARAEAARSPRDPLGDAVACGQPGTGPGVET